MDELCAVALLLSRDELVHVSRVTHMHESCHTYESVMSHI